MALCPLPTTGLHLVHITCKHVLGHFNNDNTQLYKSVRTQSGKSLHEVFRIWVIFSCYLYTKCTNLYPFNIKLYTLVQETAANSE